MTFKSAIGYANNQHESQAEADASRYLASFGIFQKRDYLPRTFYDSNAEPFKAKGDFTHIPTGVTFEFKVSSLNGVGSKATSTSQLADSRSTSDQWKAIHFGWNHSAEKLSIVQKGLAIDGKPLVPIFDRMPDAATIKRLESKGIFWLVLRTPAWVQFTQFLKLCASGAGARLAYFNPEDKRKRREPLHVFASAAWRA
jgi:hypothetical protein